MIEMGAEALGIWSPPKVGGHLEMCTQETVRILWFQEWGSEEVDSAQEHLLSAGALLSSRAFWLRILSILSDQYNLYFNCAETKWEKRLGVVK